MSLPLSYQSKATPPRGRAMRAVIVIALLLVGVQLWLLTDFWLYRPLPRVMWYLGAVAICFVPIVQRLIARFALLLRERSALSGITIFVGVTIVSMLALYATALSSGRQFTPVFHDEFAYLLQARMIADGHLWMPAHPLGDFFETFYLITDRAYAAQYFPGTAMLLAPAVLAHAAPWVMPLVLSGLACGFLFLILRSLFDATAGIAGVVVAIGVPGLRFVSIMSTAQVPALLLLLITLWAIIRWGQSHRPAWMILAGAALGWFSITRPLDAVVVALAVAAFVAWRLRRAAFLEWRRVLLAGLAPLLPFLGIQLALDRGVTGHWLTTPFGYYAERDMPGTSLGFSTFDPNRRPASSLPQKQSFYDSQVAPAARAHTPRQVWDRWLHERLKFAVTETLPDMLLIIVLPAGLLMLRRNAARGMIVAIAPLWWLAYSFHAFTFFHYYVVLVPSTLVVLFSGFEAIGTLGRSMMRASRAMRFILPVTISLLAMPQFKIDVRDQVVSNPVEAALREAIAMEIKEPRSIVLVRYAADSVAEQEVVYNIDVAWPDDAPAIRVQDLGDRDRELFAYYAQRQPDRVVYRFDRADNSMHRLGSVIELAKAASDTKLDAATTRPTIDRRDYEIDSGDLKR